MTPLAPSRRWEGAADRPESQETTCDLKSRQPSRKGVAQMRSRYVKTAATVMLASLAALATPIGVSAAAASGRVTVRVEGRSKTVLVRRHVRIRSGWVVKDGHGWGVCPRASAQGALASRTRGHWSGTWSSAYDEWFITKIHGVGPGTTSRWWELFVDGRQAQSGACQQSLSSGDHILFALVSGNGEDALGIRTRHRQAPGSRFRIRVFYYDAAGHHHALAGATTRFAGQRVKTGRRGYAWLHAGTAGKKTLRVFHRGYVRTETRVRVG